MLGRAQKEGGRQVTPQGSLDEGVVTNLREIVTSQRTDFQNCVFEPRFPHSEASKTSERWTSLMFTPSSLTVSGHVIVKQLHEK